MQPLYFDLIVNAYQLQITARLVSTVPSEADLASQMQNLQAICRTNNIVWIDASSQYQGACYLCRITQLQGPNLSSDQDGIYTADYQISAFVLIPWGTVIGNPWREAGIIFRDLSGFIKDYVLNPLSSNCNFTFTNPNTSSETFAFEFIIDNQNLYSTAEFQISNCDATTGFTTTKGSGTTISVDNVIFKQGTGAVKINGTSDGSGNLGTEVTVSAFNFKGTVDYAYLWVRADFGGNATGTIQVQIGNDSSDYYQWNFTSLNAGEWYRLILPALVPSSTSGSPSATPAFVNVIAVGAASATSNLWVDDIATDNGNYAYLEFNVPDNISQSARHTAITLYSWNGTSYVQFLNEDAFVTYVSSVSSGVYALNGLDLTTEMANVFAMYRPGPVQSTVATPFAGPSPTMTYTGTYGCNNRLGIAIKMPPASSDSNSGNVPSNDLSGFQGINKVRFKVVIAVANEDTSYPGLYAPSTLIPASGGALTGGTAGFGGSITGSGITESFEDQNGNPLNAAIITNKIGALNDTPGTNGESQYTINGSSVVGGISSGSVPITKTVVINTSKLFITNGNQLLEETLPMVESLNTGNSGSTRQYNLSEETIPMPETLAHTP